jgi:SAM-dependent methyltransferase
MAVDFGRAAADYVKHRGRFPEAFFDRLLDLGWVERGSRVLDLGAGTGAVGRGLTRRGCQVVGVDPSLPLLTRGAAADADASVTQAYVCGRAEAVAFASATFRTVIAGQAWHWFEPSAAMAEARRVLMPGGALVIMQYDWLPIAGNIVEATERLIRDDNPDWKLGGHNGIYPDWLADAATAGFTQIETFSFDVQLAYTHEAWRGRLRATGRVMRGRTHSQIEAFDDALSALLEARQPQEPFLVPHRVWAMKAVKP